MSPLKKRRGPRPAAIAAMAGAFVLVGIGIKLYGSAASYSSVVEVERGIKSGNVASITSADASKQAAVKFGGGNDIIFEDDFNGPSGSLPDASKWGDYGPCIESKQAFGEIQCGATEHMNGKGQLVVPATPTTGSGMMTWGKFGFKYGTATAWIKVPTQVGYWPAFWMLNDQLKPKGSDPFGEIDVLEYYTFQPKYAHSNGIHAWGTVNGSYGQIWGGDDNFCTIPNVEDVSQAGYVKYSVKVEPDAITSFINDRQCGKTIRKADFPMWPFAPDVDLSNYLILNLAVGGAGGQQPTPTAPAEMLVDRIEVRSN